MQKESLKKLGFMRLSEFRNHLFGATNREVKQSYQFVSEILKGIRQEKAALTKGYRRIIIDGICLGFHIDGFNNHLLEWKGQLANCWI